MKTTKLKNPRFEVYSILRNMPEREEWHWRLIAKNGEIIASGEGYTTRQGAVRGVNAVRRAVRAIDKRDAVKRLIRAVTKTDIRRKRKP